MVILIPKKTGTTPQEFLAVKTEVNQKGKIKDLDEKQHAEKDTN